MTWEQHFVSNIAHVTLQPVIDRIKSANFFSFTCDGSADFTGEDMEIVYVRTAIKGGVADQFLNIGCAQSATSADIHSHITKTFSSLGLEEEFKKKLVGFCSDGAANMQGSKSGLAALLKHTRPYLVSIHCLAHRLELSFKDTVKKSKVYERAMVLLIGLYYLYRKSPKLKNGLKESFLALKQKQVLPTRVGGTRWLPHLDRAIDAFLKGYQAIRHHLESASHTSPKAEGLAKIAADGNVITFLLCLKVVLYPLVTFSKTLQRENLTLADATSQMSATRTVLSQLKEEKHTSIEEVLGSAQYKGEKLKFVGHKTGIVVPTIAGEMIDNITSRFPANVDGAVAATYIINFKNWPNSATHLKDFGTDAVRAVVEQFRSVLEDADCDTDRIVSQWQLLKALIIEKSLHQAASAESRGYKRKSPAPEADIMHIDEDDEVQHEELDIDEVDLLEVADDEEQSDEDDEDEIDKDHVDNLIRLYSSE